MRRRSSTGVMLAVGASALFAVGCSGDRAEIGIPDASIAVDGNTGATNDTGSSTPTDDTVPPITDVTEGEAFPADRCAANRAAGTITYLSSFDFAASASIVDVLVADAEGYYDELCLDVEVRPSFSADNYPLIAGNEAQFASAGSFSELADFAGTNDPGFVALAVEGRTGIDGLIVRPDAGVTTVADLAGSTIGVQGALTPSVRAMLAHEGLVEDTDFDTLQLEGHDPATHLADPAIVGFPGYKSNEVQQLTAADIPFSFFDPSDYDIPGSFGVLYSNLAFLTEFPTAATDFMRATMRGLADAIADPAAAAEIAVASITANDNTMGLTTASETARWTVESQLVRDGSTADSPLGMPLVDLLLAEVQAYAAVGLFNGMAPVIDTLVDTSVLESIYADDGTLIWPSD